MRERVLAVLAAAVVSAGTTSEAAIFTVGPDGAYSNIQEALTQAAQTPPAPTSPVTHEIRIQRGTYLENLRAPNPCCGRRTIVLSGGWNATFSSSPKDPDLTVIDGRSLNRVLTVPRLSEGRLVVEALTLRGGYLRAGGVYGLGFGAGLQVALSGTGRFGLDRSVVRNNTIRGEAGPEAEAQGAGAMVTVQDTASLTVSRTRFLGNMIVQGGASSLGSFGGGLHVQQSGGAVSITRSDFGGNWAYGSRVSVGGGLYALIHNGGGLGMRVEDTSFDRNVVHNAIGEGAGASLRAQQHHGLIAGIRRCRFVSHLAGQSTLDVNAASLSAIEVGDSVIAEGRGGVRLMAHTATIHATNLTVADNELAGIRGTSTGGLITVYNSIAFQNAAGNLNLFGDEVTSAFNLVGIDPHFVPDGSYRIGGGSPAADAGTNAPPARLGPTDVGLQDRVYNGTVDIGAYEWHP